MTNRAVGKPARKRARSRHEGTTSVQTAPYAFVATEGVESQSLRTSRLELLAGHFWEAIDSSRRRRVAAINAPQHLVPLDRPLHLLACRVCATRGEHSHVEVLFQYHVALRQLCAFIHDAMRTGDVIPRDGATGVPVRPPVAPKWPFWTRLSDALRSHDDAVAVTLLTERMSYRDIPGLAVDPGDVVFGETHVHPAEFVKWAEARGIATFGELEDEGKKRERERVTRHSQFNRQREAITAALEAIDINPAELPPTPPGGGGVRALVWAKVKLERNIFRSQRTFENVWQKLRDDKYLIDAK